MAAFAVLVLALGGCQGSDDSQHVATNRGDQLNAMATKMKDDPTASPEARKIAAGVLRQTDQQKQLDSFSSDN